MADTQQNPVNQVQVSQMPENSEQKNSFFGGNEAVFENLEKFEQISNPTGDNDDFDFSFVENDDQKNDQAQESVQNQDLDLGNLLDSEKVKTTNVSSTSESAYDFGALSSENNLGEGKPAGVLEDEVLNLDPQNEEEEAKPLQNQEESDVDEGEESIDEGMIDMIDMPVEPSISEKEEENQVPFSEDKVFQEAVPEEENDQEASGKKSDPEENQEVPSEEQTVSVEAQAHLEMESEPEEEFSELKNKHQELYTLGRRILSLEKQISGEKEDSLSFEIMDNDSEKLQTVYQVSLTKQDEIEQVQLLKKEINHTTQEEVQHTLVFAPESKGDNLIVTVDDYLVYQEGEANNPIQKMQVLDKMNKFVFLFEERLSALEEEQEAIRIEEEKNKAVRDIFRNF